jgi:hypothetical protein
MAVPKGKLWGLPALSLNACWADVLADDDDGLGCLGPVIQWGGMDVAVVSLTVGDEVLMKEASFSILRIWTMHETTFRFVAQLHSIFDRFSIAKSAT